MLITFDDETWYLTRGLWRTPLGGCLASDYEPSALRVADYKARHPTRLFLD